MLIDTHCHLDAPEFGAHTDELILAARKAGVSALVIPAVASNNFAAVHDLCARHPECAPAYGIHPLYVEDAQATDLDLLRARLAHPDVVAVGEIGLDFFVEGLDRELQENWFAAQLKIARELDLPVLLHVRRAQDIILKHLRRTPVKGGIAHAFNGSMQQAEEFIRLGFKLGFGGAMTYSRALRLRALATQLPLSSIVLETDAPDIPPEFLERGKPNKPEYLARIAQTLAQLRGLTLEQISQATHDNAVAALPRLSRLPALQHHFE